VIVDSIIPVGPINIPRPPKRGVKVGRPAKLSRRQQEEVIRTVRDGSKTAADAGWLLGCTAQTLLAYWRATDQKARGDRFVRRRRRATRSAL
jgi:hypothetical protein